MLDDIAVACALFWVYVFAIMTLGATLGAAAGVAVLVYRAIAGV